MPSALIAVEPTTPGGRIRAARLAADVSLTRAATLIGCPQSYLSYVERNLVRPKAAWLRRLADALAVPLATFLDD